MHIGMKSYKSMSKSVPPSVSSSILLCTSVLWLLLFAEYRRVIIKTLANVAIYRPISNWLGSRANCCITSQKTHQNNFFEKFQSLQHTFQNSVNMQSLTRNRPPPTW